MAQQRTYIAIDLKSFYASVECIERGLDPLTTILAVADESRTEKTICLAATPALKAYGVPGRARLFEVVEKTREANHLRKRNAPGHRLTGESSDANQLKAHPEWAMKPIIAPPQMAKYMEYSTRIYDIYLRHVAPEDIHVYSIDEVFMDVTGYLIPRKMTPRQFATMLVQDVMAETGITATVGIGTNLYLCKIAMDIVAKHTDPDANGVRIAELDEMSYRRCLWNHRPLTDFWRIGGGYARKLEKHGMYTMGDVARCSAAPSSKYYGEDLLYNLFGVNAELLIDHAWGWEPCTLSDIKSYRPSVNSLSTGQVLHCPYGYEQTRLVIREMTELLVLDLVEKRLMTDQIALTIGYDIENLTNESIRQKYDGPVVVDYYGRRVPKHSHGTYTLHRTTSSCKIMMDAMMQLFDRIANPDLLARRITIVACRVMNEQIVQRQTICEQLDFFTDYAAEQTRRAAEDAFIARERRCQEAVVRIRQKYGKNAILKGMNLQEGGTTMDRNQQIGGHRA